MLFRRKDILFFIMAAGFHAFLLVRFFAIEEQYPYYFIYDLDFITALDTMLIRNGLLPDHINHTGFGMYLILRYTTDIARRIGFLSAADLADLRNSLNPLLGVAEITVFIRRHGPFVLLAMVQFFWIALAIIARCPRWFLLIGLVLLGSMEGLGYHAALVRTDYYSVFFWSAAVLTAASAARALGAKSRSALILATGLLMGLTFLTKIQSLFYVVSLPLFLFLFASLNQSSDRQQSSAQSLLFRGRAWAFVSLSAINLLAFRFLLFAASLYTVPAGKGSYTSKYGMTGVAIGAFLVLAALLALQVILLWRKRTHTDVFRWSCVFSLLATGFLAAFGLHFLMFSDLSGSLNYMLCDAKMIFLRNGYYDLGNPLNAKKLNGYFSFDPGALLAYKPTVFVVHGASLILLALAFFRRWIRLTPLQLGLCVGLTALCLINVVVGVRFILRDLLWAEVWLNFLTLFYLSLLVWQANRFSRIIKWIAAVGMGAVIVSNLLHLAVLPDRINANYNHFSWDPHPFCYHAFRGDQQNYTRLMHQKFNRVQMYPVAFRQTESFERAKSIAEFVFPNQRVSLREIGVMSEYFPVWTTSPSYRIEKFPSELRGSMVVDNTRLPVCNRSLFKPDLVQKHSEYLDKLRKTPEADRLAVLTRNDLQIMFFTPQDSPPAVAKHLATETTQTVQVGNGTETIVLRGYCINNYVELPVDSLSPLGFFVIRKCW